LAAAFSINHSFTSDAMDKARDAKAPPKVINPEDGN
jgi:hypothetical protein